MLAEGWNIESTTKCKRTKEVVVVLLKFLLTFGSFAVSYPSHSVPQ